METYKYNVGISKKVIFKIILTYSFAFLFFLLLFFSLSNIFNALILLLIYTILFLFIPVSFHISLYMEDKNKVVTIDTDNKIINCIKTDESASILFENIKCIEVYKNYNIRNNWSSYYFYKVIHKDEKSIPIIFTSLMVSELYKKLPEIKFERVSRAFPYVLNSDKCKTYSMPQGIPDVDEKW